MFYAEMEPSPALADSVLSHWCFESLEPVEHHLWPDGCVSLAVGLVPGQPPFVAVVGPTTSAHRIPIAGGVRYAGARFWPDRGGDVLGVPLSMLRDQNLPAVGVLGQDALALADAVAPVLRHTNLRADRAPLGAAIERWLAPRVAAAPPPDPRVRAAVRTLVAAPDTPIARVASDAGVSQRQLQRAFVRAVGLTAKEYARVRRVRAGMAVALGGAPSWAHLAAELKFSDQAHLIREFVAITGMRPGEVLKRLGDIDHGPVDP